MTDKAGINRSLNTIRTELEYLRDSGVVSPPQWQSINAQLPQPGGTPSQYIDQHYTNPPTDPSTNFPPAPVAQIAQAAQDPNHPAHPSHPKHGEWVKKLGSKLGNAAVFGAGATMGGDLVNSVLH